MGLVNVNNWNNRYSFASSSILSKVFDKFQRIATICYSVVSHSITCKQIKDLYEDCVKNKKKNEHFLLLKTCMRGCAYVWKSVCVNKWEWSKAKF